MSRSDQNASARGKFRASRLVPWLFVSITWCLPLPASAYFIEWLGPESDVASSLFFFFREAVGTETHTADGFLGINDLLFLEGETTLTVFGGATGSNLALGNVDTINRSFVVRKSTGSEISVSHSATSSDVLVNRLTLNATSRMSPRVLAMDSVPGEE